jgi:hypothetical protein
MSWQLMILRPQADTTGAQAMSQHSGYSMSALFSLLLCPAVLFVFVFLFCSCVVAVIKDQQSKKVCLQVSGWNGSVVAVLAGLRVL